jgi:Tfp pilus assembly protein PilE
VIKRERGTSFIEILIVVAVFAILGLLVARVTLVTLRGSNKSEALIKVRENLDYAMAVMERQIRNAEGVTCPNTSPTKLEYKDDRDFATYFACVMSGGGGDSYVASGSARITNNEIVITACTFTCTPSTGLNQDSVSINLEARDARSTSIESAKVSATTQIFLRTY